jgi:hypothetical protein
MLLGKILLLCNHSQHPMSRKKISISFSTELHLLKTVNAAADLHAQLTEGTPISFEYRPRSSG